MRASPVVVMWPRLGPYHVARATSAAVALARSGYQLVALETAETEAIYAWDVVADAKTFRRELLFPGTDYCTLSRRAIWQRVYCKLNELNPSVVAVCGYASADAWSAICWARRHGRGVVVMSESNRHDAPRDWFREWIKRQVVRLCDAALVGGTSARAYMHELGMTQERIFDGCDVVDNAHFLKGVEARQNHQNCGSERTPAFLTICRFVAKKNLTLLVRAYRRYCDRAGALAWRLVIAGDGEGRTELQDLARTLGLLESIAFPGFLQYEQLPDVYANASAFILPSVSEQWGLVVNEAMAAGLPVLVSQNAGCATDLVRDGRNGWAFDPGSAESLAGRMLAIHGLSWTQRQAMGEESRRMIAAWGVGRFADGLLQAVNAAHLHAMQRR